jgi:hypothetical protein
MIMRLISGVLALTLPAGVWAQSGPPKEKSADARPRSPELSDATFGEVRDQILPKPADLKWEDIPWRTSLTEALAEAARVRKPVLLWAMQGDPLGCT